MRVLFGRKVDRAAIDALALVEGWRLVAVMAEKGSRPRQITFVSRAASELVTLVEDHRIDARYLVVDGHDPAPLVELVRLSLPCLDERAVLALLEADRPRALAYLGVIAGPHASEPALGILREALGSEDPSIAAAARFAAEASGWPELSAPSAGIAIASPPLPERPRLSHDVLARMHVADGEAKVILHELASGAVLEIDRASWRALVLADGTRDLDALALALSREDLYRGEADLRALLTELNDAGVLEDGLPTPSPAAPVAPPEAPLDRPLEVLEGYTLVCDGTGSCCRFYGSVAFGPRDAREARSIGEALSLPIAGSELFTPVTGAQLDEDDVRVVAQVDGRCAFLERDGRCAIHRRRGPEAKPLPCRFYPATLVDDGAAVRVSLGPECACIFASVGRADGTPLVPADARTLRDLPSDVAVMHVPDPVPLTETRTASREALSRWSAALSRALTSSEVDAAALAWHLAEVVEREGLALDALERALLAPPAINGVEPWLRALSERASPSAATQESWRGATDLSRGVARWIARALEPVDLDLAPADGPSERFYLRALAHGHRLAVEGRTLSHGLRDRATRIFAARAMATVEPPPHTSARYPLALLEAAMRNLGLTGYADAIG